MANTRYVIRVPKKLPATSCIRVWFLCTYLLQQTGGRMRNVRRPIGQKLIASMVAGPTTPMACRLIFHLALTTSAKSVLQA